MNIFIVYSGVGREVQEVEAITSLCCFENINFTILPRVSELFKLYYKGNGVKVVIEDRCGDEPLILNGYWSFCRYMIEKGMILA